MVEWIMIGMGGLLTLLITVSVYLLLSASLRLNFWMSFVAEWKSKGTP